MNSCTEYILGLFFCKGKKTCPNIGEAIEATHDRVYRILKSFNIVSWVKLFLLLMARKVAETSKESFLIIDDTALTKKFARFIEGVAYIYDSALGRSERSLSIVVLIWSNGNITIPLGFKFWFTKELIEKEKYKKKTDIARELIIMFYTKIRCDFLLMDGLYSNIEMLNFLNDGSLTYVAKFHKHRVVTTKDGTKAQVQHHPKLKLKRNQHARTAAVTWHGIKLYITTVKRIEKGNVNIIYLVSNTRLHPNEYRRRYDLRWDIEVGFRTKKQSLGMANCLMRKIELQKAHIYCVFAAYAILQYARLNTNEENPEEILKRLRILKLPAVRAWVCSTVQIFERSA